MTVTTIKQIRFDRILSHNPKGSFKIEQPSLRLLILDHFDDDEELAQHYIETLYQETHRR